MVNLILVRTVYQLAYTAGNLYLHGRIVSDTLEPHISNCIPTGKYRLINVVSPKFDYNVLYIDAPKPWQHRELHRGNSPSDTTGCILPGLRFSHNPSYLQYSTEMLDLLIEMYNRREFEYLYIL